MGLPQTADLLPPHVFTFVRYRNRERTKISHFKAQGATFVPMEICLF